MDEVVAPVLLTKNSAFVTLGAYTTYLVKQMIRKHAKTKKR